MLTLDNAEFHLLYRVYTSLWMGSRECFEEQLGFVSADNLASQLLGGYKQLSSALHCCRYCMAHRDDVYTGK